MKFTATVTVEVRRLEGKFASREEITQLIFETLDLAEPSGFQCENEGLYEIVEWDVEMVE